ncbi:MAG: hypothetical protein IMW88_01100 [Thermoflavifilum sp.]|uniref:hypothetical protein n=1 Tax=Thermoflavifilum sp. TaxID=1968839 RepID=UPI0018A5FD81|nr:hypothetical protein [Thermoflavifilum sp.]QOR76203.1 MAG: hypothetical protein IMW88_01100 [Thermoflavifilum sp.]
MEMTMILHIRFLIRLFVKALHIIRKRKIETKRAIGCLNTIEKRMKKKFSPDLFQKITVSYGIYEPIVVEGFCRLQNRKVSIKEKNRFVYYFICSSLFDYFIDEIRMPFDRIAMLAFRPADTMPATFEETVFLFGHRWLKLQVNDLNGYVRCMYALYNAQKESFLQFDEHTSTSTILDITFRKGGYAVQLGSYYLDGMIPEIERMIWYQLGVLIQLINDLYDVWKDAPQHIVSSVLAIRDMYAFKDLFNKEIEKLWRLIQQHPAHDAAKRDFLLHIAGTLSFGYIAIDQLLKLQGKQAHLPAYDPAHRKDWIIDMEKIKNLKSWLKKTQMLYEQGLKNI